MFKLGNLNKINSNIIFGNIVIIDIDIKFKPKNISGTQICSGANPIFIIIGKLTKLYTKNDLESNLSIVNMIVNNIKLVKAEIIKNLKIASIFKKLTFSFKYINIIKQKVWHSSTNHIDSNCNVWEIHIEDKNNIMNNINSWILLFKKIRIKQLIISIKNVIYVLFINNKNIKKDKKIKLFFFFVKNAK